MVHVFFFKQLPYQLFDQLFVLWSTLFYHSFCRPITDITDEVVQQTNGSYLGKGTILSAMLDNTLMHPDTLN